MSGLPMFITVDELAAVPRCQPERVYRLAARGKLASYKVEGRRLFKRILRSAEARRQIVDPTVFHIRVARPEEREPRFLTWDEAEEVRSWMPEHVSRVVPIAILTMLRRGELLGLRDSDIDVDHGAITVVGQRKEGGGRGRRRAPDGARLTSARPPSSSSASSSSRAHRTPTASSSPRARARPTKRTTS